MKTYDPVNQYLIEQEISSGPEELGLMNGSVWRDDPKRLVFSLSRYKFVAKMLSGFGDVVEVGCGDGFGSRIVRQEVNNLLVTDIDPMFIERFSKVESTNWSIEAAVHDILEQPLGHRYDALYCLDVMEHIKKEKEATFLSNICHSLRDDGVAIIGMPSIESQIYASPESKEGHVNCKTGDQLRYSLNKYFDNVFIFSMNDEIVHTGFFPMAHYLIGLCCGPKLKIV
jgi:2-polyprenyl-3-methyl-5-hydroxy-6-metoxy-1,4-benzoquinol methylase